MCWSASPSVWTCFRNRAGQTATRVRPWVSRGPMRATPSHSASARPPVLQFSETRPLGVVRSRVKYPLRPDYRSPSRSVREIAPSSSSCSGLILSSTRRRTRCRWKGTAVSSAERPAEVIVTFTARPSPLDRRTRPRLHIRVSWWCRRLFSHPSFRPSSTARSPRPSASDRTASTVYSACDSPRRPGGVARVGLAEPPATRRTHARRSAPGR